MTPTFCFGFWKATNYCRRRVAQIIADSQNDVFVSIASLWETAIKISIGKLTLVASLSDVIKQINALDIEILPISPAHVLQVSVLPFHHRDPFDRLIIAQAQIENISVITDRQTLYCLWN